MASQNQQNAAFNTRGFLTLISSYFFAFFFHMPGIMILTKAEMRPNAGLLGRHEAAAAMKHTRRSRCMTVPLVF